MRGIVSAADEAAEPAADEVARLAAVHRYEVLDTPADGTFDRITAVAARTFGVPMAMVSIVDRGRIRFTSHHGMAGVDLVGRGPGLWASAILHAEPWVVADASVDPRTSAHPLVTGDLGVRFYAGVPLRTADGHSLGTLCVLDTKPREVTEDELATLTDLAAIVVDQLELRFATQEAVRIESALRREAEHLADALQASLLPPRPPDVPGMEIASRYLPGDHSVDVGGDFFDVFRLASNDWGLVLGDACGKGVRAASLAALARWSVRAAAVHQFEPSDVLADVNAVLRLESDADDHFCSMVFGRLELDTCGAWITVASAGHPLPMLVRASGKIEARGHHGVPVGLFDTIATADDRVGLGPGDALVFYTDGITEARPGTGELFGDDRLREVLQACVGASADEIAQRVVDAARRFGGGLRDDVAVLVVAVPHDLAPDPLGRVVQATGVAPEALRLPGYPHDTGPATTA